MPFSLVGIKKAGNHFDSLHGVLLCFCVVLMITCLYDVEEGKVVHSEVVDTNGSGHGALAGVLKALNADVLICGGIGGGAQTALAAAGIKLFGGVSGDADEAVEAFINETLEYNPDVKCSHHEHSHGEGHTCGEHGCGSHSCH